MAFVKPAPIDELDGHLWNGTSYFEATTGGYHQKWESRKGNNPPIIMHAFDKWASVAYMRTALDWWVTVTTFEVVLALPVARLGLVSFGLVPH